ncbi:MAG: acyl-CoA thioesterase [Tabrizicola sp.]|nr:acyl-CoA thioesterase [Tabrizicola sp.]
MTNSVCETFFRDVAGHSYAAMMAAREGVPTARIEVDFRAPSRLGETLDWRLGVNRLGRTSIAFRLEAWGDGLHRLSALLTLVFVDGAGRPKPWPDAMRERIAAFMESA